MLYPTSYMVEGRILASTEIEADHSPRSIAYICTTCGNVWGRVIVNDPEGLQVWEAEPSPCARHLHRGVVDYGRIPGSFLFGKGNFRKQDLRVTAWGRAIEHLPEEVLKYEFDITMKHFERMENDSQES